MPRFSTIFTAPLPRGPALIVGLLALSACSSPVTSERNDAVPIPSGATVSFAGAQSDAGAQVNPAVASDSVHHMIQQAIITQLKQKGYTVVDSGRPSTFTVQYFLSVSRSQEFVPTGGGVAGPDVSGYKGYGYGYGRDASQELASADPATVNNGIYEVDLVDQRLGRTAWRGIYQRVPRNAAPNEKRINSLTAEIFKTLPKVP